MAKNNENTDKSFNSITRGVVSHLITILLTLGGVWLFQNRPVNIYSRIIPVTPEPINLEIYNKEQPVNYSADTIESERELAIEEFSKNDILAGQKAVESLLNRGAFLDAKVALDAVPKASKNDPNINFLQGRLAWELLQDGNQNYTVDEALFYWKKAVDKRPDSIPYQNAIGFAYYTKGDLKKAYEAWLQVLKLSGEISPETQILQNISTETQPTPAVEQKETLNAYAGIGLVMMKSAQISGANEQKERWLRSLQYRTKVMKEAAMEYHIPELRKNWLWSRVALRDWDFLMRVDWNVLGKTKNHG